MNMKYYNASNNFSAPIKREPKPYSPYQRRPEVIVPQRPAYSSERRFEQNRSEPVGYRHNQQTTAPTEEKSQSTKNLDLNNLQADDLLLLGIIALLIWNACDDTLLILILGYLFISGLQ